MEPLFFKRIAALRNYDILNSEGPIVSLVESTNENLEKERIYLKARCLEGKYNIYIPINIKILELYFQSRISLLEVFLIRKDQEYLLQDIHSGKQNLVSWDEYLENEILGTIECRSFYHCYPIGMRLQDPYSVIDILKRDYINCCGSESFECLTGEKFLQDNQDILED